MTACIVGWSHLAFGRRDQDDVESMICSVASEAINDSGFGPADIDALYLGHFGGAFSPQGFTSSLVFFNPRMHCVSSLLQGSKMLVRQVAPLCIRA